MLVFYFFLLFQTWVRKIAPIVGNSTSYAVAFVSQREDGAPYSIIAVPAQLGLNHARGYNLVDLYDESKVFETYYSNRSLAVRVNPSGSFYTDAVKNVCKLQLIFLTLLFSGVVFYKFTPRE